MGALVCDRRGCGNAMCDRYSDKYGYICDECFEELISTGLSTDISMFMAFEKQKKMDISKIFPFRL